MKKLCCAAVALLLTAFTCFGQGIKVQAFTTNSGPVVTNIVISLSSNLLPNRLSATNSSISGLRVYAATNQNGLGFWLDPTTITPGAATNSPWPVQGSNTVLTTNGLQVTINATTDTNVVRTIINTQMLRGTNIFVGTNFTGNGAGLTNLVGNGSAFTNLPNPWKTVGITNGDFGPFTPGTTTSGIQEAIDSFSKGTNGRPNGVWLKFTLGNFYFTNAITYSNNWNYQFDWEGAGKYGTRWIYAGTNRGINTVDIRGGGNASPSLNCSGDVNFYGGVFTAIHPVTNVLLRVTNANSIVLRRITFSSWKSDTAQDWMSTTSGNSDQSDYTITTNGLVGAVLGNVNDWGVKMVECEAGFLAAGVVLHSDHVKVIDFIDPLCGVNAAAQDQTAWPISSPFRTGAGIIRYPGLDAVYERFHSYADRIGFVLMNYPGGGNTEVQVFNDPLFEGGTGFATIVTNGNVFAVTAQGQETQAGPFSIANQARLNTNDFSALTLSPISLRGAVWNDIAYLVRPEANGGLHIKSGQLDGNLGGGTNLPGIYPVGLPILATNSFTVIGSGDANLDGIWTFNSSRNAYTNSRFPTTGAFRDDASVPGQPYITFTNATFDLLDPIAYTELQNVSNSFPAWLSASFTQDKMYTFFSTATNKQALIDGRLSKIQAAPAHVIENGGVYAVNSESVIFVSNNIPSTIVTLPDARTNSGRVIMIVNGNGVCDVRTVNSQRLNGLTSTIMTANQGFLVAAANETWKIVADFAYSGAGLTNIQQAALVYPAANPAAGLVLTSTSSNTAAWLAPTASGGDGILTFNGTGTNTYIKNLVVGGLGFFATNGSGSITASLIPQNGTITVSSYAQASELRLVDADGSNLDTVKAASVTLSNLTWILPDRAPSGTETLLAVNNNDGTITLSYGNSSGIQTNGGTGINNRFTNATTVNLTNLAALNLGLDGTGTSSSSHQIVPSASGLNIFNNFGGGQADGALSLGFMAASSGIRTVGITNNDGRILSTNTSTTAHLIYTNGLMQIFGGSGAQSAQIQLSNNVANASSNALFYPGSARLISSSSPNLELTNTSGSSQRLNISSEAGFATFLYGNSSGFGSMQIVSGGLKLPSTVNTTPKISFRDGNSPILDAVTDGNLRVQGAFQATTTITATNGFIRIDTSTFPTSSVPVGSASVTNTLDIVYKGFPRTVATNRATTQGWMYWRTTDETWQTFTP